MDEYVANRKKEEKIVKKIRTKFKRWKIGRWFVFALALLVVYSIINNAITGVEELTRGAEGILVYILGIIAFALLPFIAMLIAYAISMGGGRDILLARSAEKVYLDSTQLRNVFTPNFKQITKADIVEICVPYENIREMIWKQDLCRLEITAEHKIILTNYDVSSENTVADKPVILYGYFNSMDKMLNQLESYTNKKITGRN